MQTILGDNDQPVTNLARRVLAFCDHEIDRVHGAALLGLSQLTAINGHLVLALGQRFERHGLGNVQAHQCIEINHSCSPSCW